MAEAVPEQAEPSKVWKIVRIVAIITLHLLFVAYFIWATVTFITFEDKVNCTSTPENLLEPTEPSATDEGTNEEGFRIRKKREAAGEITRHILCEIDFCHGYGFLIIIFVTFYIFVLYYTLFKPYIGLKIYEKAIEPAIDAWMRFSRTLIPSIVMLIIAIVIIVGVTVYESRNDWEKIRGLSAPVLFVCIGVLVSTDRKAIPWRIFVHGILLQFILCILILHWSTGRDVFKCAGDKVARFLDYARDGALFVYGEDIVNAFVFAFAILAVVFFFAVSTSILHYLGWMQPFLLKTGWLLQAMIGTTVCESVNAAGNIFLSMSESPLMIKPYIELLTNSELHTICTSGYATVAGTVLGAFIHFGASAAHLVAASVMAAPGSLGFVKVFYPETEESQTTSENIEIIKSEDKSFLDAAASGASTGLLIVLGIVSNIIAFISIVAFFNAVIGWMFELVGFDGISLVLILTWIFMPLSYLMGVPWEDCESVSSLIAIKTLINEFVAYQNMGEMIKANKLQPRSIVIATFALCGFANPGSLGILIAALSIMAPQRRSDITRVAVRAFFTGSIVSFTSASFAGILMLEDNI